MKRILFAGGGTGGHLYPALALADALRERGEIDPVFLVEGEGVARTVLEGEGVRLLEAGPPPVSGGARLRPLARGRVAAAIARTLDRERIDAVVALGGRPGVGPGLWARWRRRPLFLLEQNRVLGRANRLLLPLATRIFLSHDDTTPERALRRRALRLGCPVRASFVPTPLPAGEPRLLILGGSQGAQDINELVPAALEQARRPWRVTHICGAGKEEGLANRYRSAGLLATVRAFLQDPSRALAEASLVVARAGGSTVAELTAVGRGSLLLPYPHHRDRHQFRNAAHLVEGGAAEVIEKDVEALARRLDDLREDSAMRERWGNAARALGRPAAAGRIADVISTHLGSDEHRRRDALGVDRTPHAEGAGDSTMVGSLDGGRGVH
ncbi:MAG: UDP-N-acetylglucosamine--N-acetylmuramyl-(pentapeptide) pyrophosphoryl-undecaprenol N-acetylglucosamine transferase [Planctomycetota bacterium]|jgi:UDP-N-acetylglucosamine--N-acetylmuramyl-(pentapeptide) pyrophosphoryl-undecaprenol N-acetylglucosamine transferase